MGLAPTIVAELFASIKRINQSEGVSFLMVEQNAVDAIALCDHGYVMENGRIVLHGDRAALVANEDIREFYLGLSVTSQRQSFRDVKHYRRRKRWLG
jgi:branched-chain amino acid transport system ATP-binding protein